MVAIPDNIRPYIDVVVRYHFWMLVPLVPLIVLPLLFLTNGWLGTQMDSARSQIESRISAVRSVAGVHPHPNAAWSNDVNAGTDAVKRQTFEEWQRFWESQQPMRVWPASLGADFVQRAEAARLDSKLSRKLLERYQNGVRAIVRELPARMGADEMMIEPEAGLNRADPVLNRADPGLNRADPVLNRADPGLNRADPGLNRADPVLNRADPGLNPRDSNRLVEWSPADQKRLYESFDWEKPPTTPQVLLAQEEIWVYGLLCDSIERMNKGAAGAYAAAIPRVEQLAVGYPAAEDDPGGAGSARILVPPPSGQADVPPPPRGNAAASVGPRPLHPRFGDGITAAAAAPPPPPPEEGGPSAGAPDDALRNWIYVDFDGRPLSAAELASSANMRMVHLMPFTLRVVIDERSLDALLVDLAGSPVPIDVRQVRINVSGGGGQKPADPRGAAGDTNVSTGRPHDISVELRGTVGLATPPDAKVLGIEIPPEAGPGADGQDRPGNEAATAPPATTRRRREFGRAESIA
jgi:hypothetical protein